MYMTCAKCRHNREISRMVAEQARLREICSKCRLGEDIAGDGSVSLDAIHDGTLARVAAVAPERAASCTFDPCALDEPERGPSADERARDALTTLLACVAALPFDEVARLASVAEVFRGLTRQEFGIVAHLLNGGTLAGYAAANGLTRQTAFARVKALFRARPAFRAIANGGLTHGRGGRRAAPKSVFQPDLFGEEAAE